MKNQKISQVTTLKHKKKLLVVALSAKPSPRSHRIIETCGHKWKRDRYSGHSHKRELASLIEKTLQEDDFLGREGVQQSEDDLSCLKEIKKKVCENKNDKDSCHKQEESIQVDTSENTKAKTEINLEEIFLGIKKDLSSFVEIDLRDTVEEVGVNEKTEDIMTDGKEHKKEEESPDTVYGAF